LISTTSLLQSYPDEEEIACKSDPMTLSAMSHDPTSNPVAIFINSSTNLPIGTTYCYDVSIAVPAVMLATINEVSAANYNLSEPENECCFLTSHFGFVWEDIPINFMLGFAIFLLFSPFFFFTSFS
jgi:hypothetical protein